MNLYILYRRLIIDSDLRGSIEMVVFARLLEIATKTKLKQTRYGIFIFHPMIKNRDVIRDLVKQYQNKNLLTRMIFDFKARRSFPEIKF